MGVRVHNRWIEWWAQIKLHLMPGQIQGWQQTSIGTISDRIQSASGYRVLWDKHHGLLRMCVPKCSECSACQFHRPVQVGMAENAPYYVCVHILAEHTLGHACMHK
jgi:hypothetical protein